MPITKIRKRIARNYPKHITKLFAKCKYLSKHKHLPDGIQKWRTAQIGYMLAIQQFVYNRERTILESGDCAAFYKYVNSQRVCREGVAPLVDAHGDLAELYGSPEGRGFKRSIFIRVYHGRREFT